MKILIDALTPVDVAAYLAARGWQRGASFREDKASLWFAPGRREVDVLLPLRSNVADYALRMGALVSEVAAFEGRSPQEVLRDVAAASADVIRVRIVTGGAMVATLPLINGVNLLKRIRDVLIAAALATIEKRPFFTNRRPETILEFMDQLQLGQTEYSSFVFTVASPIGESDAAPSSLASGEATAEPFGRRVTHTLMHALDAMEKAASSAARDGDLKPFLRAVEEGVSGNLCDAVVELKSICPHNPIEFSVTWAATRPPPADRIDKVVLRQDSIAYIEAASDAFWGMPKKFDFRIEGMVRELESPESARSGTAMLMGYVDARPVDVRVSFDDAAYPDVVHAFRSRAIVRCEGDLVREEGVYTLKNARYFRVLQGADGD